MKTVHSNHMNLCTFNGEVSAIICDENDKAKANIYTDLFTISKPQKISKGSSKMIKFEPLGKINL